MPSLTLYYFPSCPFCQMVLQYMKQRGIRVPLKDILSQKAYREELIKIGGSSQVPCLVIDGKPLYESDDIIQWFESNWREAHVG